MALEKADAPNAGGSEMCLTWRRLLDRSVVDGRALQQEGGHRAPEKRRAKSLTISYLQRLSSRTRRLIQLVELDHRLCCGSDTCKCL
jgi:hypothetical protein